MADTTFVNAVTLSDADWFNDLNRLHYTIFGDPADLAAVFGRINSLTAETGVATDDVLLLYDTSASTADKITVANFLKIVAALTAETSPATDDELLLYDLSATTADKITLANLFKVINSFTEDTTPDLEADYVATYDASATAAKKVLPTKLMTIPQNSKSAAYTTVLTDANKHILHPASDNNARTFTIDSNANVPYPIGTCITFINEINTVTIAITSDTLKLAGTGSTGSRTLAANGIATAIKTGTTTWWISGTGLT